MATVPANRDDRAKNRMGSRAAHAAARRAGQASRRRIVEPEATRLYPLRESASMVGSPAPLEVRPVHVASDPAPP